jgi:hypothetical protein
VQRKEEGNREIDRISATKLDEKRRTSEAAVA